jgi:murein DD-endopeptidase MepM/ murein hydrolase activator NlpD
MVGGMAGHDEDPLVNGNDERAQVSSPNGIAARSSGVRRIVVGVATILVLASVAAVGLNGFVSADEDVLNETKHELKETKHDLHKAKDRYRAQIRKIRILQKVMNHLATRISRAEGKILRIEIRLAKLQEHMRKLQIRAALLQAKLDQRSREAYMSGGVPILYLLTATSAANAAARMSFLAEMNRRDAVLARQVQATTDRLAQIETEVVRGRQLVELQKRRLETKRAELRRKMAKSRRLVAGLRGRIEQIQIEISLIRPFAVCPVGGSIAIADNFGDLRRDPKGGTHSHQGDDITAASGSPILAPFDGEATVSHSRLGGLGVYVHGEFGFVYNAHLSRLGTLGPVEAGDVIGYVGSTGHSSGPHDHFEWHPENGSAVDPYQYLMLVCSAPAPV